LWAMIFVNRHRIVTFCIKQRLEKPANLQPLKR
jgi:hypothetical protein